MVDIELVSVIIPMYNAENTIIRALNSVLIQTYHNIEIIIVDDGSIDNSAQLAQDFIINNPSFDIRLISKDNGGVSSARNMGMKNSRGEWIALLDSDDIWISFKLERQLELLHKHPEIDFLGTSRNNIIITDIFGIRLNNLSKITAKQQLVKYVYAPTTVIFKKCILDKVGYFDESQRYMEDGNYFIRISKSCNTYLLNESLISNCGKELYGESGLSGNLKGMYLGELKNITDAYKLNVINIIEYIFLNLFSTLKYVRRIIITKINKFKCFKNMEL